ncbi:MAG: hypothetical protein M3M85_00440 [bacterium]|nr:hypothetical protein [bacterium]
MQWWLHREASRVTGKTLRYTRLGAKGVVVWGVFENALNEQDLKTLNDDSALVAKEATEKEVRGIMEPRVPQAEATQ